MKLSNEQIKYIEDDVKSSGVKYYEIYIELVDHMIESVQAILEEEKIDFEEAFARAKRQEFGSNGFKSIADERLKMMNKSNRKEYVLHLKSYFTFPYFALTFLVFVGCYFSMMLVEKPNSFTIILIFPMIAYAVVDWSRNHFKFHKKEKLKVLKIQGFGYVVNLVTIWLSLFNFSGIFGSDRLNSSYEYKILASLMLTMCFISFLFYIKISRKIMKEVKQEIFVY